MQEEAKTDRLHSRSFLWLRMQNHSPVPISDRRSREYVQSKQLYRSGTSIGANVRESKNAQSEADFLSKISIAYKEADKSDYWLNLLHDNVYLDDEQFDSLEKDITRILKIMTSIVKTMKEKLKDKKNNH